ATAPPYPTGVVCDWKSLMSGTDRSVRLPYRVISTLLFCAWIGFAVAVATGFLEVRRPRSGSPEPVTKAESIPTPYVQRVKIAERLLDEKSGVLWVYKFAGGWPKCWAEIESEGHKQTLGPWVSIKHLERSGVQRPLPESVEGYVALFEPASTEQTYRLVCGVTKIEYQEGS